jgi:hypothetical protein
MASAERVISTSIADVIAEPDSTVVLRFFPGSRATAETAAEVARAHVAAARGRKCPALADLRGMHSSDRAAREVGAGPDVVAITSHMAVLVGSPMTSIIGNFFLRVTRPAYRTRLFTDEGAARRWLREARNE